MRKLSRRAFSELDVTADDVPAPIEQARAQRRRQAVATEAAALRRARSERSAREAGATAIGPRPAGLRCPPQVTKITIGTLSQ
ncbi:hypothetical protein ACIA74_44725 [Streptomyces sp. NPDC051658]|uniref:hypothetical protein n=1 Tax=Streptomyces sp. NPDC051658 TaxID=3365667 RepID=UPI003798D707